MSGRGLRPFRAASVCHEVKLAKILYPFHETAFKEQSSLNVFAKHLSLLALRSEAENFTAKLATASVSASRRLRVGDST